jgi:hypothetical protein
MWSVHVGSKGRNVRAEMRQVRACAVVGEINVSYCSCLVGSNEAVVSGQWSGVRGQGSVKTKDWLDHWAVATEFGASPVSHRENLVKTLNLSIFS